MDNKIHLNDEDLLELIKKNNSNALKILFLRYYKNLCYFAFSFLHNTQLAEEAVADIFENIWEKRKRITVTSTLKSYLYTAVKNQSLNYMRQNKVKFENIDIVDQAMISVEMNTEDSVDYKLIKNTIDNMIDKLPEKRKLIFCMNRFDELTYEEIAEILSISVSTVKNQMVKAIKFMSSQYPALKKIISVLIFLSLK